MLLQSLLVDFSIILLFHNHYLMKIIKAAIKYYFLVNLGSMMLAMLIWGASINSRWILYEGQWVVGRCRNG